MAKRKRLTAARVPVQGATPALQAKAQPVTRAPIADIASEAAATAALDQVSQALSTARESGRMVLELRLEQIALDYLVRDRVAADEEEMQDLMTSIATRGQHHPVDVMEVSPGQYGLISGWRRCQAIAELAAAGRHDGTVLALLRRPSDAAQAYHAMVEENEIRVGLSYFERARIALKAVEQGIFETEKAALLTLFANASRPKRSKIRAFLPLVAAFDGVLAYPHMIGERLGLKLSAALTADPDLAARLTQHIKTQALPNAEAEQAWLQQVVAQKATELAPQGLPARPEETSEPKRVHVNIGTRLRASWSEGEDWLRLSGPDMSPALRDQILDLLRRQSR